LILLVFCGTAEQAAEKGSQAGANLAGAKQAAEKLRLHSGITN
jgi:hypothetical protein